MLKNKFKKFLAAFTAVTMLGIPTLPAAAEGAPQVAVVEDVSEATAMSLAQALVGDGVEVISAEMTGNAQAFGTFDNAADLVGFSKGLVVSTGGLRSDGQNIFSAGYTEFFSTALDGQSYNGADLPGFDPSQTFYDLNMLDITYIPTTDHVSFQYSVASEEYPEYISYYFDQFVLLVNGVNYALVPETGELVTIGTVNHAHNAQYYRGITTEYSAANAISTSNFVYDGITTTFSVSAPVTPGEENTIRIAIADKGDAVYDSAVFIKGNSIKEQAAAPGTITVSEITDNKLTLDREKGTDGFVAVDVTFQDSDKDVIGTENVTFNDGEGKKQIEVPSNAVYFFLTASAGGVTVKDNVSTSQSIENFVPETDYSISGIVTAKEVSVISVSGGDAANGSDGSGANAGITVSGGDAEPVPVADAQVVLNGAGTSRVAMTNGEGNFYFGKLNKGVYQISVEKEGKSGVEIVTVDGENTECSIELHNGVTAMNVGDTGIMVGGLGSLLAADSSALDDDDLKIMADQGYIEVAFNVSSASGEDIKKLEDFAGKTFAGVYNFEVTKTGKSLEGDSVYDAKKIPDTGSLIEIVMPLQDGQKNMTDFRIYRVHEGVVDTITESANGDGEYIEVRKEEEVVILHVRKFSAYTTLVGEEVNNDNSDDESDSNGHNNTTGTPVKSPKTGESGTMVPWMGMGILAAVAVVYGKKAVTNKKK